MTFKNTEQFNGDPRVAPSLAQLEAAPRVNPPGKETGILDRIPNGIWSQAVHRAKLAGKAAVILAVLAAGGYSQEATADPSLAFAAEEVISKQPSRAELEAELAALREELEAERAKRIIPPGTPVVDGRTGDWMIALEEGGFRPANADDLRVVQPGGSSPSSSSADHPLSAIGERDSFTMKPATKPYTAGLSRVAPSIHSAQSGGASSSFSGNK